MSSWWVTQYPEKSCHQGSGVGFGQGLLGEGDVERRRTSGDGKVPWDSADSIGDDIYIYTPSD